MEINEILEIIWSSALFIILFALMLVGLGISLINSIGTFIIWGSILIAGIIDGFDRVSIWVILLFLLITICSAFIDNLTQLVGARQMGAGKWGIVGAFLGGLIGLFAGGIVGAIIGPFIGAFLFELLFEDKDIKDAFRAGLGTFIGYVVAVALKFGVGLAMIGVWIYQWFW